MSNPFVGYGKPIEDRQRLIGRGQIINQIYADVVAGANCSITGLRRIGKTSVMMAVLRKMENEAPDINYAFFDFSTYENEAGFYNDVIRSFGGSCEDEDEGNSSRSFRRLKAFLRDHKVNSGRCVIAIDEFDEICKKGVFDRPDMVLNRLRSITQQSIYGVSIIVVSRRSLLRIQEEVSARDGIDNVSNLAQTCQRFPIAPLSFAATMEIIVRSGCEWNDSGREQVFKLCGGHPYLTEELLYHIVENNNDALSIDEERVLSVYSQKCETDFLSYLATVRDFSQKSGCWKYLCEMMAGVERTENDMLKYSTLKEYGLIKGSDDGSFTMSDLMDCFVTDSIPSCVALFILIGEVEKSLRMLVEKKMSEKYSQNWIHEVREQPFYDRLLTELEVIRKKEYRHFHASNSQDVLEYAYPGNLKDIIIHEWPLFQRVFHDRKARFIEQMDSICAVRQPLAHHRVARLVPEEARQKAASACSEIRDEIINAFSNNW